MTAPDARPIGTANGWRTRRLLLVALVICLATGASCNEFDPPTGPGLDPRTLLDCQQVDQAMSLELDSIQRCTLASECGQVLSGTSCGCTRDKVARRGVSTTTFYTIVQRGRSLRCSVTDFVSTCDCPAADGFACVAGRCTWNYR